MVFDDLISFIENDMQMMANYQPIIIKTIVEHMWESKDVESDELKAELEFYNPGKVVNVSTGINALKNHDVVTEIMDKYNKLFENWNNA